MKWFNFKIFLLYLYVSCLQCLAQYKDLKFQHLTAKDGLSYGEVSSIVQDKIGFLWFGTSDGLNKYDGYSFKVYKSNREDSTSLINNLIFKLYIDSFDDLWIGTSEGLCRYNTDLDYFSNILPAVTNYNETIELRIRAIAEDSNKDIYIATEKGLIMRYDKLKNKLIKAHIPQLPQINVMLIDKNDCFWAGGSDGLFFYNPKNQEFKKIIAEPDNPKALISNTILSLCDDNDKLWIGTEDNGLNLLDKNNCKVERFIPETPGDRRILKIYKDNLNEILIGDAQGIKFYDRKKNIFYNYQADENNKDALISAGTTAIFKDLQGNLWVATSLGGLNISYKQKGFVRFTVKNADPLGLSKKNVSSILEDSKDNLWIGYYNGGVDILNRKNKSKIHFEPTGQPFSLPGSTVFSIFEDSRQNIWIGIYSSGLQLFDWHTNRFLSYNQVPGDPKSLNGRDVRSIQEDWEGNFWLITHGTGANKFIRKNNTFLHFPNKPDDPKSFPDNWAFVCLLNKDGNLWVGSPNGLSLVDSNGITIKTYRNIPHNKTSLSSNSINCLYADVNTNLWIGTNEGLNLKIDEGDSFIRFTLAEGLSNTYIQGILEDSKENIWCSTNAGISKLIRPLKNPENVAKWKIKNYDEEDGLHGDEFFQRTCFKSKHTGELFFGGKNGVTSFFPDSIQENIYIPNVVITDFKLFNKSVSINENNSPLKKAITLTKEITLKYNQNFITIEFVALNFIQPDKNQYAYKMEGLDSKILGWNYCGKEHKAIYTNLDPGTYTFRVKASNNDGIWNEQGTFLKIKILPPFWQTKWAYTGYFLFLALLFYILRRVIVNREKLKNQVKFTRLEAEKTHEIDMLKLRFFTNISHEFRTPLTLITGPLEKLLNINDFDNSVKVHLNLMYRNAQRLMRLINELMDFRKLDSGFLKLEATKDDIVKFITDIANAFYSHSLQRNISYSVNSDIEHLFAWFDPDKLDKIIYNLISNAFKFTPDNGKISVSLSVKEIPDDTIIHKNYFVVEIIDTGVGIPRDSISKIFDRFYQVENTPHFSQEGTGIGLTLTKELVELHKGSIKVESELGKGTRFTVILPLGEEHLQHHQKVMQDMNIHERVASIEHLSIIKNTTPIENIDNEQDENAPLLLIIEDDEDVRFFITEELKTAYRIIQAIDGSMGFDKAIETIPDLIISDIMMPGIDGIELCKKLKNDERTSHIPVILLTAKHSVEHQIEGYETGADDYVTKPFSATVLMARAKNLIDSRKRLKQIFSNEPVFEPSKIASNQVDHAFLIKAVEIVEKNLTNTEFDPSALASEIGMSRAQLYRKFKGLTDQTVSDFIRAIRLNKATELLLNKNLNINEIAFMVGFSDPSNFTRSFTKHFGMPPSKYTGNK